jgi:integrase
MQREIGSISQDAAPLNQRDQNPSIGRRETVSTIDSAVYSQIWLIETPLCPGPEKDRRPEISKSGDSFKEDETDRARPPMNVADFVERVFIPRYVMSKTTAGRAHFQGMLKHILLPERTALVFRPDGKSRTRLAAVPGWPYLDDVPLSEVRPANVEQLIQASMSRGYSSQMATHLRNVIRNILSFAASCGYFTGPNPATFVSVPSIAHKPVRALSLSQLKQIFDLMGYPEQQIALFALLTDMNVAEIRGLKWKHVNLTNAVHFGSEEPLPARTIAVKMQIYRGEYRTIVGRRNRLVQIPEFLQSALVLLKHRPEHNSGEDFVLVSRRGTPVNPDNIAARHLKAIGQVLDLSWLSWKVFHRTGVELQAKFGRYMNKELGNALTLKH